MSRRAARIHDNTETDRGLENKLLHKKACLSARNRGRAVSEDEDEIRTSFQRCRDRIIHSKAFRKAETQDPGISGADHYWTRLIHVLEVSQTARMVTKALRLNEDLAFFIALK